ncbi:uncharacterized protein LOC142232847 [Haematobia irritans]|uniref:uncharacterized protein LOC142232847 n=1 Tax=Haematobia irritans TaxID=7368 RepID=UPI003F50B1EF
MLDEHMTIKVEREEKQQTINDELLIKQEPEADTNYPDVLDAVGQENVLVKQEIGSVTDNAELHVLRTETPPPKRPRRSTRNAVEVKQQNICATPSLPTKQEPEETKDSDEESDSSPSIDTRAPGEKRFSCDQCSRSFNKHYRLIEHMYVHTNEKPFTCDECGKQFRLQIRMNEHKQRHSKKQRFVCNICNLGCCTKPDLNLHMRHHTNDRRFQCTMCPKAFVRSSDLKTHVRVHTGEKPYACEVCHKSFRANQNLIVHKKLHLGEASKIFKCEYCEKRFLRNSDRKIHMRSHTGEKPFKCEMCDRCYSSNVNVKAHMQRDHLGEEPRIRKKPGPKPKDWKEEVAKQQKLIEELQNQLKQRIKMEAEENIAADKHHSVIVTKVEKEEQQTIIQKISVTVSMKLENVTPSTSSNEQGNQQEHSQNENQGSNCSTIKKERKSTR